MSVRRKDRAKPVAILGLMVATLLACGSDGPPPEAALPADHYLAPVEDQDVTVAPTTTAVETSEMPASSASSDIVVKLRGTVRPPPPASSSAPPRKSR